MEKHGGIMYGNGTVSYTHLDVYKRQALKIACDLVDEGMRTEEEAVAMILSLIHIFTRNEGVVSSSLISGLIKTQFRFFGTAFFYGARRVPESVFRRFMWLRFPVEN